MLVDWQRLNVLLEPPIVSNMMPFYILFENYENIVSKIEDFLQIDANEHTDKYGCLDPELSRQGFMTWKNEKSQGHAYSLIKKELSYLCYD